MKIILDNSKRLAILGFVDRKEYFRAWRVKHPGYYSAVCKRYRAAHPGEHSIRVKKWCESNPEKAFAYSQVRIALASGDLKRLPCEVCGNHRSHAHHDDYSKPLDVQWLCPLHHRSKHI